MDATVAARRRPPTPRSLRSLRLPISLAIVAVVAAAMAVQSERVAAAPEPLRQASPITPVLSPRRVPELLTARIAQDRLAARLDAIVATSPGTTCLSVVAEGHSLYGLNTTQPMIPASLEKLLTASAALQVLGPDTRLATSVRASRPPNAGVIDGDLFLVGGGDPALMTDDYFAGLKRPPGERSSLEQLAERVVNAGVRSVGGRVLGDESRYDTQRYNPRWLPVIASEVDIGPLSALTLNGGLDRYPPNRRVGRPSPHPSPDPARTAAERFTELLQARGVSVGAGAATGVAPANAAEIAKLESVTVAALVGYMLRESDNTTAELLTKEMGVRSGAGGSFEAGVAVISAHIAALGVSTAGSDRVDGSGLSFDDRITCEMLQALLDRSSPDGLAMKGLPVAGSTGTLAERFLGPLKGRLKAKTGTLNNVTGLAGYLTTSKGARLSFTYILNLPRNQVIGPNTIGLQNDLAATLDSYPDTPEVSALAPKPPP